MSTSDNDRYGLNQGFQNMETTQNAYHEAAVSSENGSGSNAKVKKQVYPPRFPKQTPPVKTGPAVEAPKQ